jgi:hypothetical protein
MTINIINDRAVDRCDIVLVHKDFPMCIKVCVSKLLRSRSIEESDARRFLTTLERRVSDYLIDNWKETTPQKEQQEQEQESNMKQEGKST